VFLPSERRVTPENDEAALMGAFARADARTRTGDPFITREVQGRNARQLALTNGHLETGAIGAVACDSADAGLEPVQVADHRRAVVLAADEATGA
jgi:hypothetical protein